MNEDYKIRNAVRVFLFNGNKVVCIKYKNNGYYDIPGGKIEENGMIIVDLTKIGIHEIIYPSAKENLL